MSRVLLLLTLLNHGGTAAALDGGRWNVSAVRRRAAQRRRPQMSASAAYETWTRARIDGPNFDRFADFAGACMRGHDACRAPSDAGQCEDACRTLRWNFHARRLVERVLKVRSGSVLEEGYNWPLGSTPARPPSRPSPIRDDGRRRELGSPMSGVPGRIRVIHGCAVDHNRPSTRVLGFANGNYGQ
jgi:hypothetical protein